MNIVLKISLICAASLIILIIVGFCALLAYVLHQQHAYRDLPDTHDLARRVSQMGDEYISSRPNGGLVIGVFQKGGQFITGFGRVSVTNASKPDGLTIFEIGSISKVLTALTLAKLAGDGVVKLDDPISKCLPPGVVSPQMNGREITLGQLATHTSGLPRLPDNLDRSITNQDNPYANYHATNLYQELAAVHLRREPGKSSEYSNFGFGLLGHLLALKTGLPYGTLVRQAICEPLGMSDTTIHLTPEQLARFSPGHDPQGVVAANWDFDALAGCGAFRSDATDLLKLLAANLTTNNAPIYQALAEARRFHFKQFSGGVGLGWQIQEPVENRIVHWHNGGTGGYVSYIGFDREHHAAVVILSNYGDAWAGDLAVDRMGMEILKLATKISWQ